MNESKYLLKHSYLPRQISAPINNDTGMVVVIPAYNEPDIFTTLNSLNNCQRPDYKVEVIIVINAGFSNAEDIKNQNLQTKTEIEQFVSKVMPWFTIYPLLFNDLPDKYAGVGLARKIGMDEACRRMIGEGLIIAFDADSRCAPNFFVELNRCFREKDISGCSIDFQHDLDVDKYGQQVIDSIISYELHLRYFIEMQRRIKLPYAFQTIGSSMAVRKSYYEKLGGMNKRKAGEDFYFIQKFIKNGKFGECNSTTVYPSPRISDRVPFGTGKAIGDMIAGKQSDYKTYDPESFKIIDQFIQHCLNWFKNDKFELPDQLMEFFSTDKVLLKLREIKSHTSSYTTFKERFYLWFDAFRLMKTLHFLRDHHFQNIPVTQALRKAGILPNAKSPLEMLHFLRESVVT